MTQAFSSPSKPGKVFFMDWELWQKFTFVLGCAITLTFLAGLCKLWYMRRFVRKHEIIDEEKKVRINEMRQSGISIAPKKEGADIPFGVRALENGVLVEGIYTERNSLKASRNADRSSGSFASTGITPSIKSLDVAAGQTITTRLSPSPTSSGIFSGHIRNVSDGQIMPSVGTGASATRTSYKPQRSSQLRHGSHGDTLYHAKSLAQLEGRLSPIPRVHRPRGTPNNDPVFDFSSDATADNERNSGTSEESDGTLTDLRDSRPKSRVAFDLLGTPVADSLAKQKSSNYEHQAKAASGRSSFKGYAAVESQSPEDLDRSDPFSTTDAMGRYNQTPQLYSTQGSHLGSLSLRRNYAESSNVSSEVNVPLLAENEQGLSPEPAFGPGILHVNKSVRKSNSGFEIHPAGTFGARAEFQGPQIVEDEASTLADEKNTSKFGLKRTSNRLSKERPSSLKKKGRRSSTFADRI